MFMQLEYITPLSHQQHVIMLSLTLVNFLLLEEVSTSIRNK